jgi:flagellar hook-associated protein 3 FlgL
MIARVTTTTMMHSASRNMQSAAAELSRLQEKASTQKNISRPSDDPAGTAASLQVRTEQKLNAQYTKNVADGNEWLTTIDSSLSSATALLQRANILAVQGANDGALTPAAKESIALELESIRDSLLNLANTQYAGRSVFAGTSDAAEAYKPTTYAFSGGQGTVERRIGEGVTIRVDGDGAAIFGTGENSVFAQLNNIASDLRAGTNIGPHITTLATRLTTVSSQQAVIGSRQATVLSAGETLLDAKVSLESRRVSIEDVDLAEIILDLKMQETAYQASLAVTARALQPTLMDFLS